MVREDYRAALQAAIAERDQLTQQRDQINVRLMQLDLTIRGLSILVGQTELIARHAERETIGLRDAIRAVFRNAGTELSPTEVRDTLLAMGFNFSGFANPMAAIHNTLQRMVPAELNYITNWKKYRLNR